MVTLEKQANGFSKPAPATNGHGHHDTIISAARLAKPPSNDQRIYEIIPRLEREKRIFDHFVRIDLAHLIMLAEQGVIDKSSAARILGALQCIRTAGVDNLEIDPARNSLLFQIEAQLVAKLGEDVAGQLHTGRSRIDQGSTARRLSERDELLKVMGELFNLLQTLLQVAARNDDTIMPTYTHLQQCQPGNFGHYLLGVFERLNDDFDRCQGAFARTNLSPLGCVGLSGTSWPLDRERTRELLGFDGLVYNTRIAREAYHAAEIASTLALLLGTINDLATDLHIWSSLEFGMIALDDSDSSTSSIFPQKKNPVLLETIRYQAGTATSWGSTALATFRGEGTGDQAMRSVSLLENAFTSTRNCLHIMAGVLERLEPNKRRMNELVRQSWSTSSNLADVLVKDCGLSFRSAHHVVARLVKLCLDQKVDKADVTSELLRKASTQTLGRVVSLDEASLRSALDHVEFIRTRSTTGSVSPVEVEDMLRKGAKLLASRQEWLRETKDGLNRSEAALEEGAARVEEGF